MSHSHYFDSCKINGRNNEHRFCIKFYIFQLLTEIICSHRIGFYGEYGIYQETVLKKHAKFQPPCSLFPQPPFLQLIPLDMNYAATNLPIIRGPDMVENKCTNICFGQYLSLIHI